MKAGSILSALATLSLLKFFGFKVGKIFWQHVFSAYCSHFAVANDGWYAVDMNCLVTTIRPYSFEGGKNALSGLMFFFNF